MPIENRYSTCATCNGQIYRYPNPDPSGADSWAHTERDSWINNPHPIVPKDVE